MEAGASSQNYPAVRSWMHLRSITISKFPSLEKYACFSRYPNFVPPRSRRALDETAQDQISSTPNP
jgi:hypothetical protein